MSTFSSFLSVGPSLLLRSGKPPVQITVTSYGYSKEGVQCGTPPYNINFDTSVAYWNTWIEDMLSFYNLRGTTPGTRVNKLEKSKCYSGTSTIILTTTLPGYKCCDTCRALSTCKAWTHRYQTNSCTLFKVKGSTAASNDCTSGYF